MRDGKYRNTDWTGPLFHVGPTRFPWREARFWTSRRDACQLQRADRLIILLEIAALLHPLCCFMHLGSMPLLTRLLLVTLRLLQAGSRAGMSAATGLAAEAEEMPMEYGA